MGTESLTTWVALAIVALLILIMAALIVVGIARIVRGWFERK
jgi:hypothetical protein